ncbi:hypothetical protein BDY21DRAFT_353229 [Lineolata rhizophorae]|uniref:Uncharacterized protein n=1 Tax=Lineolata rhizophorae TaxID=578093 RepID=A0A6A6NRQ4_9PEZI|nr:hypothetical protein BDY21DRAFT_353229 [Lineolata rhizophorae]
MIVERGKKRERSVLTRLYLTCRAASLRGQSAATEEGPPFAQGPSPPLMTKHHVLGSDPRRQSAKSAPRSFTSLGLRCFLLSRLGMCRYIKTVAGSPSNLANSGGKHNFAFPSYLSPLCDGLHRTLELFSSSRSNWLPARCSGAGVWRKACFRFVIEPSRIRATPHHC